MPHILPHTPGDLAVELADPVETAAQAQRQHGHVKARVRVTRVLAAQGHELLARQFQRGIIVRKIGLDQLRSKDVNACRHRGMGGKDVAGRGGLVRLRKRKLVLAHELADTLQPQKGGMPLVQMHHVRLKPQGVQGANAANAQDNLLLDAHLVVAAIQFIGNILVFLRIVRDVGIEQIQGDAAHLRPPDLDANGATGQVNRHSERATVLSSF